MTPKSIIDRMTLIAVRSLRILLGPARSATELCEKVEFLLEAADEVLLERIESGPDDATRQRFHDPTHRLLTALKSVLQALSRTMARVGTMESQLAALMAAATLLLANDLQ